MLQIQLYIEGEEVELYKDESITLTQSIQDIKDIEKIFTDYTRTFSVPASKVNNKVFKHFYNYFIDGFDARKKKDALIHLNYKPFKKGKIKLEGVTLKNNEPHTYRITFFGNTVTLPDLLGEDKLANLTELSAFDFRYNDTNIEAFLTNGKDANIGEEQINDGIIFPLISHSNRLIYDSSANQTYNLYTTGGDNGVPFSELKPALRIPAIIRAIELHYDIEFSNDFFSSTNKPYYDLYLWLHTKAGGLFEDQEKTQQFKSYNLVGSKVDNLTIRSNNFRVQRPKRTIEFDIRFKVTPANSSTEYNLVVQDAGQEFRRFDSLTGTTYNGVADGSPYDYITVDDGEFSVFIETGSAETFNLEVYIKRKKTSFIKNTKTCTLTSELQTFTDTEISITSQLPDIKVLDFLTGLFKLFNLTAFVNDEGTIVVQTLDNFFASSTKTHDITEYVIADESQVDATIPYKQINFKYEGLNTFLAKNFERMNNKGWGTIEYQSTAKFEGETYEIEVPFEHLLYERLSDANDGTRTNIQVGYHVDEKQEANVELPLLFYAVKPSTGTIAARTIGNTKVDISLPYMPSNSVELWSSYNFEHMKQSLNFHSEIDEYALVSNERTLFKTYYEKYIKDVFDVRKRITKISAYLPITVTQNLSLADGIVIFDKLYRINTITTNFETNRSDLELTNILDDTVAPVDIRTIEVDTASDEFTIDNAVFTVDRTNVTADGFIVSDTPEVIPIEIPSNEPRSFTLEPLIVTAATIEEGASVGEASKITFKYNITKSGRLGGVDNIDEFGFLIALSSSTLTASDDIDTLKADSNITVASVVRTSGSPTLTIGLKSTVVDGLSDPATRYARFYVRTNTNPDYDEADVISAVFSESTDAGLGATADSSLITVDDTNSYTADFGDSDGDGEPEAQAETLFYMRTAGNGAYGYSTIPSLSTIRENYYVQNFSADCGDTAIVSTAYHNGANAYPETGDNVKFFESYNYAGGSNSAPSNYDDNTNIYYALAIATNDTVTGTNNFQGTIERYIVVEYDTAEVVATYNCPVVSTTPILRNADVFQGLSSEFTIADSSANAMCGRDQSLIGFAYQFEHNGTGENPEVGDQIKFTAIDGIATPLTGFNGDRSNLIFSIPSSPTAAEKFILDWNYLGLTVLDDNNIIRALMVIEKSTAEVTNIVYCDAT